MNFRKQPLSSSQLQHAINVSPKEFPENMPCAVCGFFWMQHMGTLCPARAGYFDPLTMHPVMPVFQNTETFIPDVMYFNQSPDFDVE